jgi:hypothetical protein
MYKSNASRSALSLYDWNTTAVNKFVQTIKDAKAKKKKMTLLTLVRVKPVMTKECDYNWMVWRRGWGGGGVLPKNKNTNTYDGFCSIIAGRVTFGQMTAPKNTSIHVIIPMYKSLKYKSPIVGLILAIAANSFLGKNITPNIEKTMIHTEIKNKT